MDLGYTVSGGVGRRADHRAAQQADLVVTVGCGDTCPYVPGVRYRDLELHDPKGQDVATVRQTRDEISRRVRGLVDEAAA